MFLNVQIVRNLSHQPIDFQSLFHNFSPVSEHSRIQADAAKPTPAEPTASKTAASEPMSSIDGQEEKVPAEAETTPAPIVTVVNIDQGEREASRTTFFGGTKCILCFNNLCECG